MHNFDKKPEYPFEYNDESLKTPKYNGYTTQSLYVTMRDGIKIAADIYKPKRLETNEKIPTILVQTRYWRAYKFRIPFRWFIKEPRKPKVVKIFTIYGFAVVWVDTRGTGASYGTRPYPFSEKEIKDAKDLIDWIINQSWSDGNVMLYGNSYEGVTAELTTSLCHPAIKGAIIKHDPWDFYLHAVFPGGVFNEKFLQYWSSLGKELDQTSGKAVLEMKPYNPTFARIARLAVKSVKPVKSQDKNKSLKDVAKIHKKNNYPIDYFEIVNYRDDEIDNEGTTIEDISIYSKKNLIEKSHIPMYTWGSWQDSTTANATILRFINFSNPQKAIISDWCHRDQNRASPFHSHKAPAEPGKKDQLKELVKFYNDCLKDKIDSEKVLYYYTMGEEKWKKINSWPPPTQEMIKWYLNEDYQLSKNKPKKKSGSDQYIINFESTTGIRNRWYTLLSLPVKYNNRDIEDKKLLVYTSEPLKKSIEITGHPIINFYLRSTHEDGLIQVHFEFIDENEEIHWITDGQLRLIHRKISSESPPYNMITPFHSFKSDDILPIKKDEVAKIRFALYPTSILLKEGYKMRIAIGGADKDSFARYPEEGTPKITLEHNEKYDSHLEIPIIK
ncbi:MAG: CocE/NonD family hydrolase [Candidatus Lokiarchaeota archaeon]|nr:CocE/NonD family hydrolase [Candidatus Lokiarchaeota archaeon]